MNDLASFFLAQFKTPEQAADWLMRRALVMYELGAIRHCRRYMAARYLIVHNFVRRAA